MLKKCTAALALLTLCLMASVAFAGVMSFPKFKINVPDGWEATQDDETVILTAIDMSAAISITVDAAEGAQAKEIADAYAKELQGSTPVKDAALGGYRFTFKKGAAESTAMVTVNGKDYILLVVTGENPQLAAILGSLTDK